MQKQTCTKKTGHIRSSGWLAGVWFVVFTCFTTSFGQFWGGGGSTNPTHSNLSYGPAESNKLDLYIPSSGDGPFPVIVWIHGGAWMGGSKDDPLAQELFDIVSSEGIAVASIEHTMSSGAKWPVQSQECKAAVRWVRAHAEEYNLNPDRIGTGGMSSGGHLASFLGTSGDIGEATAGAVTMDLEGSIGGNTEYSSRVQAVLDMYGPTNFLTMSEPCPGNNPQVSTLDHEGASAPESMLIGGPIRQNQDKVTLANPIHFVSEDDPPFLILHGTNDALVPSCNSKELHEALAETYSQNETEHSLHILNGQQHGFGPSVMEDTVAAFFKRHLLEPQTKVKDVHEAEKVPTVSINGFFYANSGNNLLTFKVFDMAGHVVLSGRLAPRSSIDLRKTGNGLRLCEFRGKGKETRRFKVVCP